MEISVTLSANAGVALHIGGHRIWVDALHTGKQPGFSTLTPQLQRQMLQVDSFQKPEYICYTHDHPDHYSKQLTEVAQNLNPRAQVLLPERDWGTERYFADGDLKLRFVRLPHEGEQYADVLHYGLIISCQGYNVLLSGDCAVASDALANGIKDIPIHLALLDFPWATLQKGRKFLQQYLVGAQIALIHLPFAEDDGNDYRIAAANAAKLIPNCQLLCDPFETKRINI